ncbi:MAG: hypothetical protein HRT47_06465 [Candidatus Caenarcaniphilales bacterium]|nr:hypothetical protein [Candidatus Caenarcaniphilales bacterium]
MENKLILDNRTANALIRSILPNVDNPSLKKAYDDVKAEGDETDLKNFVSTVDVLTAIPIESYVKGRAFGENSFDGLMSDLREVMTFDEFKETTLAKSLNTTERVITDDGEDKSAKLKDFKEVLNHYVDAWK